MTRSTPAPSAGGATLSYSAAVGGGTPILETLERLGEDGVGASRSRA